MWWAFLLSAAPLRLATGRFRLDINALLLSAPSLDSLCGSSTQPNLPGDADVEVPATSRSEPQGKAP